MTDMSRPETTKKVLAKRKTMKTSVNFLQHPRQRKFLGRPSEKQAN